MAQIEWRHVLDLANQSIHIAIEEPNYNDAVNEADIPYFDEL